MGDRERIPMLFGDQRPGSSFFKAPGASKVVRAQHARNTRATQKVASGTGGPFGRILGYILGPTVVEGPAVMEILKEIVEILKDVGEILKGINEIITEIAELLEKISELLEEINETLNEINKVLMEI